MKEQQTAIYNGIAFFRRPLRIKGKNIYGILYNQEVEKHRENTPNCITNYMIYLTAMESFLHNGGDTNKTKNIWIMPDGYTVQCNTFGFQALLQTLFKSFTKYSTIEFDEPLGYTPDEVDGCFITNISFMERYVFPNPDQIIDKF